MYWCVVNDREDLRVKKCCEAKKKIQPNQFALQPDPVRPPWAPVLAIRMMASASVVHVIEVPGEFTRGKAAQIKGALHWVMANFPPTHCANPPEIQAFCPPTKKSAIAGNRKLRRLTGTARVCGECSKLGI